MSAPAITDELLTLADAIGDVKTRFEKLEAEFSTQARPLEAAATALQASLAGIKALQFHVLDNNLGALSQRVEEQRRAIDEQIGVIVTELRKADDDNRATLGASKDELAQQIAGLQTQIGQLHTQFARELDRVQLEAKAKVEALALLPGPQGAQGESVKPRGAYDANTAYNRLEIVSWMGGSYISNEDGNREKPGAKSKKWTMLASRGGPGGGSGDITGLTGVALPAQIVSGASTYTVGDILYANSTSTLAKLPAGDSGKLLSTQGAGSAPIWVAATGGAGDMNGPASATDNALVRFDGTGGKTVQNSGVTVDDSGNISVSGGTATVDATSGTAAALLNLVGRTGGAARTASIQATAAGSAVISAEGAGSALTVAANTGNLTSIGTVTAQGTGASSFAGSIATQGGTASTPASASAAGTAGTILWDASYVYVCVATNQWKRAALSTW